MKTGVHTYKSWIEQCTVSLCAIITGIFGFQILCAMARIWPSISSPASICIGALILVGCLLSANWSLYRSGPDTRQSILSLGVLIAAIIFIFLTTVSNLSGYISLPADLLSFGESMYVTVILKLRMGLPLYMLPGDNNSYPYTPGSPILTYLISSLLGQRESIPFYRMVQMSYVLLAGVVSAGSCHNLARLFLGESYRNRLLWLLIWTPILFLVAIDDRYNLYNHSLHNDGLSLLITACGFWLVTRHALTDKLWLLMAMALLPAIGFFVKQTQLMWSGVFLLYLLVSGTVGLRGIVAIIAGMLLSLFAVICTCYGLWGQNFLWWVFEALGAKEVNIFRAIFHFMDGGVYFVLTLLSGWLLLCRNPTRKGIALLLCGLAVLLIGAYTSGFVWVHNHMGPGILLNTCWPLVALVALWPKPKKESTLSKNWTRSSAAVMSVVFLVAGMGHLRDPRNPVPTDFHRYVTDIEREFEDISAEHVLMDTGTWIYLRENILMKDRSTPAAIHAGMNQAKINHDALADTITRICSGTYKRILARQLDTSYSAYDYQNRGTGIKEAIYSNYKEVRRIAPVEGVGQWWPKLLLEEIIVLEPKIGNTSFNLKPSGEIETCVNEKQMGF